MAKDMIGVPARPWQEFCESGDWWVNGVDAEGNLIDGAFVCHSDEEIFRNQETLQFILDTVNERAVLAEQILGVLDAQQVYFKNRTQAALVESKRLEAELRRAAQMVLDAARGTERDDTPEQSTLL